MLKHQLSPQLRVIPGGAESLTGSMGISSLISQQSSVGAGSRESDHCNQMLGPRGQCRAPTEPTTWLAELTKSKPCGPRVHAVGHMLCQF